MPPKKYNLVPGETIHGKLILEIVPVCGRAYYAVRYACCGREALISHGTLVKPSTTACVDCRPGYRVTSGKRQLTMRERNKRNSEIWQNHRGGGK